MTHPLGLTTDPWSWSQDQRADWLELLGTELERSFPTDNEPDISKAIHRLAETLKPDDTPDFGSQLTDLTDEAFYELSRTIVYYGGDYGMAAGISLVDFGSEKLFVFELPSEDFGIDLALLNVVHRDDTDGIVEAANHLMEREWIPDKISISEPITRTHLKDAHRRGLNKGVENDWKSLSDIMSEDGHVLPFATEAEREKLLEAYLKQALDE